MKNRNGSYKKIFLTPDELSPHRDFLASNIAALKTHSLSEADFTAFYILLYLRIKHPKNWLQKKSQVRSLEINVSSLGTNILTHLPESFNLTNWEKEKLKDVTTFTLFSSYNLKGIPDSINRTMVNWYLGFWKIKMLEYIPSSRKLLRLQVENTRCITLITDPDALTSLVLETRDPLSFVLHDLMHADHFFSHSESLKGQLGFYHLLNSIYDQPQLKKVLSDDQQFKKEFEYVASDMNAYVIHLFKCLKSACERISDNLENRLFSSMLDWWNMTAEETACALKLNTPHFSLDDELMLKKFFENNQEIFP